MRIAALPVLLAALTGAARAAEQARPLPPPTVPTVRMSSQEARASVAKAEKEDAELRRLAAEAARLLQAPLPPKPASGMADLSRVLMRRRSAQEQSRAPIVAGLREPMMDDCLRDAKGDKAAAGRCGADVDALLKRVEAQHAPKSAAASSDYMAAWQRWTAEVKRRSEAMEALKAKRVEVDALLQNVSFALNGWEPKTDPVYLNLLARVAKIRKSVERTMDPFKNGPAGR